MYDTLFGQNASIFAIPAILGTLVFGLRMLMLLIGGDGDGALGDGADDPGGIDGLELDGSDGDDGGAHSDQAFRIISINAIAAFLMGAGWAGLGAYKGSGLDMKWSVLAAIGGGALMAWIFARLMTAVYNLQSSGNITASDIVGHEAEVDVAVPGSHAGQGTIKLVVSERLRRYRAVSAGEELERGATVRVVKINADNTALVERA